MACAERWGFEFSAERIERLLDILHGDRFDFAGGQVISRDVAMVDPSASKAVRPW